VLQWISGRLAQDALRRKVVALLVKLSAATGVLPPDLFIRGVVLDDDRDPWASGGFADVFRGRYGSQKVAVKRPRLLSEEKEVVNPVWNS
jgi:hypothetical protein